MRDGTRPRLSTRRHPTAAEIRAVVARIAADCIPAPIAVVHWRPASQVTAEQLAAFDEAVGTAERRCVDELAGYDDETIESAIEDPRDPYPTGVDFLLAQVGRIRAVLAASSEDRVEQLVSGAVRAEGSARVGYSRRDFTEARERLPLELRRAERDGLARTVAADLAYRWLDRFDVAAAVDCTPSTFGAWDHDDTYQYDAPEPAEVTLSDRIAELLDDGCERAPAEIARYLSWRPQAVRSQLSLMARDGHVATRGDGFYFGTDETRQKRAVRVARRQQLHAPDSPIIARYLEHCERRGLRPTYVAEVRITLRRVEIVVGRLETATAEQIEGWWNDLDVGPGGRIAYAAHVSGFYGWLVWERLRVDDPTARLIRPRQPRKLPRPIKDDELRRAFALADGPMGAWLALAAYAGLRSCEIATVHREDVDDDLDALIVRDGKGGKQRIVPLHPEVSSRLAALPMPDTGPLFVDSRGEPLKANTVCAYANRFLHKTVGTPATLHQLRHWFGTRLYRTSTDLRLCQEMLGHASPTTTARYTAWSPERAAGFVNALTVDD